MPEENTSRHWEEKERVQTTLRLSAQLKEELQVEAARKGISLNALILLLIDKGRRC